MTTLMLRCRDAEMMGPLCDYITEETPIDEAVQEMRVIAKTHNEPEITDQDVADMKALMGQEECSTEECYCSEECCFVDDCC